MQKRDAVLIFLHNDNEVLLAESSYRPGKITWNGISGFIEGKEKPEEAAIRTLYQEVKLRVYPNDLEQAGVMHLYTITEDGVREETLRLTIFLCDKFQGEPRMTPGVRPRWFNFATIPYENMFEDTKEWLERILGGEKLIIEVISKIDEKTNQLNVAHVLVRNILERYYE
jgi:ADP-ribose pyrophosphatase YjhB (NUDIX family)